uniref:ATPase n=1 Tax=Fervidicoccus fontis TaxID=683846 RepID=A0A7J3ZIT9_9CREN
MRIAVADVTRESYVLDLASIMQGIPTLLVERGLIGEQCTVLVHRAIIAYLEKLASEGKATGITGLEELKTLNSKAKERGIEVLVVGEVPRDPRLLEPLNINLLVRELAREANSTLITSDKVSLLAAEAMGVKTLYIAGKERRRLALERFFDKDTMSVHLIEGVPPIAKKGSPGYWTFQRISDEPISRSEIELIVEELVEEARAREDSFIEIDRAGSTIIQLGLYRIVVSRPPMSSRWEVTAVRPLVKLSLSDYNLHPKLLARLEEKAEGILIAGAPGMGKTTFAQALAEYHASKGKVVKTIESPRDMNLPPSIVQYSKNLAVKDELHDILLLSRPDYTFFDELRGDDDFKLYVDLRLAGIGMVGVLHATSPIDAVQRFIGRVELGVIPSIIDTVIFIDKGRISKVYEIAMTVKLPTGLKEAELSRPVVEVRDFLTGELEYEIYTFGEQTVVVPVKKAVRHAGRLIAQLRRQIETLLPNATVDFEDNTVVIRVPRSEARLAAKRARRLRKLSEKYNFDVRFETVE